MLNVIFNMKTYKTKRRIAKVKRIKNEYTVIFLILMIGIWTIGTFNNSTVKSIGQLWQISKDEKSNFPEMKDVKISEQSIPRQIRIYAHEEKFEDVDYLLKLAKCESRFDPFALNGNNGHSIDRGVFQINKYYHPEVTTDCAMDIECATKWTIDMLKRDQHWQWSCDKIVRR